MLDRLSMAASTSGGTDTFSRMKLGISRPYFALRAGLISGSSASPSSVYRVATSSAGTLGVAELPEVDELRHLGLADDELSAPLDLSVFVGKPVRQRVPGVIGPFDDLDQLALDEVHQPHVRLLRLPA